MSCEFSNQYFSYTLKKDAVTSFQMAGMMVGASTFSVFSDMYNKLHILIYIQGFNYTPLHNMIKFKSNFTNIGLAVVNVSSLKSSAWLFSVKNKKKTFI